MMPGGSEPPDLDYIANLLEQHQPDPIGTVPHDENRSPPNLVLTPTSWKADHWLKPPPDLPSHCKLDRVDLMGSVKSLSTLSSDQSGVDALTEDDRPWRPAKSMIHDATESAPPSLDGDRSGPPDKLVLHRCTEDLQLQLQSTIASKAELEQALQVAKSREQAAHDELNKYNETIRELRRINQNLVEERALFEAKTSAQLRKEERIRSRLEAEVVRQKDLVRDITEEASRLRTALQDAANDTEMCIQREKENWARAEALRNEQLIQRLKQDAVQAPLLRTGDAAIRERDLQLAELNLRLAEQQRLLERQQKDNERLADQATKLQEMLDQLRSERKSSSEIAHTQEVPTKTRSDVSESTQANIDVHNLFCSEFGELKQQLKQISEHFLSVDSRLEKQSADQRDFQKQISELESRFKSMEADVRSKQSMLEPLGQRSSLTNDVVARQQLAHHLQRAAELGVDLPPHMPLMPPHSATKQTTGESARTSISSTISSKTKSLRKPVMTKKSVKRTQARSPVKSRLYPPPTSWR